jgi:hypothetical protein
MSSYTDVQAKATALGLNLIHLEGLNKFALQKPYHGPGQDWWQWTNWHNLRVIESMLETIAQRPDGVPEDPPDYPSYEWRRPLQADLFD